MATYRPEGNPTQHKQAIKAAQKKLDELYKSLGVRTYACMKERDLGLPELELLRREIDETMRIMDQSSAELERLRAIKQVAKGASCPQCGMKTPAGCIVCPYCWMKVVALAELPPDKPEMIICPNCSGEITADAVFCGLCGKQVVEQEPASEASLPVEAAVMEAENEPAAEMPAPEPPAIPESAPSVFKEPEPVPQSSPAIVSQPAEPSDKLSDTFLRGSTQKPPIPVEPAVPAEKKCASCGEVQRSEAAFCFNCGKKLAI